MEGSMNGWISVKDRLPESDGSYIVATKNGGVMMTHFYQGRHGTPGKFSSTRMNALITHWMERPKPPEDIVDRQKRQQHDQLLSLKGKLSDVLDHEPADSGDDEEDEVWKQANDLYEALNEFFGGKV